LIESEFQCDLLHLLVRSSTNGEAIRFRAIFRAYFPRLTINGAGPESSTTHARNRSSMPGTFGSIGLLLSTNKSGSVIASSIYDYGSFWKSHSKKAFGSGLCKLTLKYCHLLHQLSCPRPRPYCQFRRKSLESNVVRFCAKWY
jgi:hypothetical protein